jgi:hypothetical protein
MNLKDLNEKTQAAFAATFRKVVTFKTGEGDYDREQRPKVFYDELEPLRDIVRGVYVIVLNDNDAVYVGSFNCGLGKRWFYTRDQYVYHHKAGDIANELKKNQNVALYLLPERDFVDNVPASVRAFVNAIGVEAALRRSNDFPWNGTE